MKLPKFAHDLGIASEHKPRDPLWPMSSTLSSTNLSLAVPHLNVNSSHAIKTGSQTPPKLIKCRLPYVQKQNMNDLPGKSAPLTEE